MLSKNLARRSFLQTSLILTAFPGSCWLGKVCGAEDAPSDVLLRFAVMSDVHFSSNPESDEKKRLEKALTFLGTYASEAPHPHFDALVVAGDMTNHGHAEELELFRKTLFGGLPKETQALLCMGNHEFYGGKAHQTAGGSRRHWETIFSRAANTHSVLNGFHFIGISPDRGTCGNGDYAGSLEWLRHELEAASAEDARKPVFVFQHYHISGTVYGSCGEDHWGIRDLKPVLDDFPQVIDFSGHSHYPANDPRSAWQEKFTAFGTATLSYFEMAGGIFEKFPEGYRNAAQFYVVEVLRDFSVHLKIYDLISDSFFETEYLVAEPGAAEKHCYSSGRFETAAPPAWSEPLPDLKFDEVDPFGATLHFPQAHDAQCVGSYQIAIEQKNVGQGETGTETKAETKAETETSKAVWRPFSEQNPWSQYFFRPQPEEMSVLLNLEPETEWRVTVRARNVFGKLSGQSLSGTFRTLRDEEAGTERNADFPQANVVNFFVNSEGQLRNEPVSAIFPHGIETFGKPQISSENSGAGTENAFWATFDGTKDRGRILFTEKQYSRLKRQITLGARFRFDAFKPGRTEDVFSNTEGGGVCLELNHSAGTLEFWCHVGGSYQIISAPVRPGTHTAFGVFDGKSVILYLDGKEAVRRDAVGPLTFTQNQSARAFCVGSDIANGGAGSAFFAGGIQFAKAFNWALNSKQIENLSR